MHRITVSLPEDMAAVLVREADRAGTSVSEIVRRAVSAALGVGDEEPRTLPFAGIGRSGERHTARNAEDILAREWAGARDR